MSSSIFVESSGRVMLLRSSWGLRVVHSAACDMPPFDGQRVSAEALASFQCEGAYLLFSCVIAGSRCNAALCRCGRCLRSISLSRSRSTWSGRLWAGRALRSSRLCCPGSLVSALDCCLLL